MVNFISLSEKLSRIYFKKFDKNSEELNAYYQLCDALGEALDKSGFKRPSVDFCAKIYGTDYSHMRKKLAYINEKRNVVSKATLNKYYEELNASQYVLKKYMEDFSLLNEKEVPAIEVWEHYLVYATAFGIADKVLKQLKTIYPNIDELDAINTSTYMYFMYHSDFQTSFSNSISSSISSSYTSASGGGGGFSGGGGGGRRPEEAVVEDKLSQNHITEII